MKTWNENLATVKLKGCFPLTALKLGFHTLEIQQQCVSSPSAKFEAKIEMK